MSLFDIVEGVLKSVQSDFRSLSSEVFSSIDYVIEDSLNMASSSSLDIGFETIKEVAFGGAIGLCAGYAAKKAGAPVLIGVASASFFLLRGAIFDGHIQASWSPLAIDDASFARYFVFNRFMLIEILCCPPSL